MASFLLDTGVSEESFEGARQMLAGDSDRLADASLGLLVFALPF
jgi:hypothetical protein